MADIDIERKKKSPFPWILGLLALAILAFLLMRSCGDDDPDPAVVPVTDTTTAVTTPATDTTTFAPATDTMLAPATDTTTAPAATTPGTDTTAGTAGVGADTTP